MTHISRLFFTTIFTICLSTSIFAFAGNAPNWLINAAKQSTPTYDKKVPAVALHKDTKVTLETNGKLVTVENYAVRILNREGISEAIARAFYLVSSGKVRSINAWLVRNGGKTKSYGKKETLDIISDPDDVYNEYRLKIIDATGDAGVGQVFGYTVISEEKPLYFQEKWFFQTNLPTLFSRYTLNLPTGWKAKGITFNRDEVSPQVSGNSYSWEMRNLPYIENEPMSPSVVNLVPWLAVNYMPEDSSQVKQNKIFNTWKEISEWATAMYDPQVIINDEIAIKAKELTANAKNEFEKIYAIGKYVQNLQYISIDIGVGHGNGYKPRPSDLVLKRGYGDCKDKATLMRAMLETLKIKSFPVIIYAGDPTFVREKWASPGQFNHAIIAVKVKDETKSPTIINDEKLGRLLIFDATDDLTPVGDLPSHLQGSLALIAAGKDGRLTKMPITPPEMNVLERTVEAKLTETGSINGTIREVTRGQSAKFERALHRKLSQSDYKKIIERWLTSGSAASKLVNFESKDNYINAGFELNVEFSAPIYGQLMQNRLLIFKPAVVSRLRGTSLTEKERTHPVRMESTSFKEVAVFELPKGFTVDEVPDALNLETSFGKYSTKYEEKEGKLIFRRELITKRSIVPPEKYKTVKDFYTEIINAEQSPVVLLRN